MTDFTTLAAALYPDLAPGHSTAPVEQTTVAASTAEPVKPSTETAEQTSTPADEPVAAEVSVPDDIKAARVADLARRLYGAQALLGDAVKEGDLFGEGSEVPAQTQTAVTAEFREMATDLCMTKQDLSSVMTAARSIKETPSDEQRIAWREEAVTKLNETYRNDAASVYKDAMTLVRRDPRVVEMLNAKGIGDHPSVILQFAALAKRARFEGKLS